MKVIKDNHNTFKMRCNHCSSMLEVGAADVQDCAVSGRTWVKCGACNQDAHVSGDMIPSHIKKTIIGMAKGIKK